MSLLDEIMVGALDQRTRLSDVLRRCKVLAFGIKDAELSTWVDNELNGYQTRDSVPEYRRIAATLRASGSNSAWVITGQEVPVYALPEKLQQVASSVWLFQDVASLEKRNDNQALKFTAPDAVRYWIEHEGGGNVNVTSVYLEAPPGSVSGVLSAIRNKIVDSLLTI